MTLPNELPVGSWQNLLLKALTLVDEILKHGGVSNPFFTFGGGTVPMLRYRHRISKDIAFFVSDPQALGYATPRLSDVADALCDSQYTEASNFVKLHLDEGEIGFVASSNLCPTNMPLRRGNFSSDPFASRRPRRLSQRRCITRGNPGTARDLFEPSMVVERQRDALRHARPFMSRHLEALADGLDARPFALNERFAPIERLNHSPTFDHPVGIVRTDFAELRAVRQRAASQAEAFASAHNLAWHRIDTIRGEYDGPMIHLTERHTVQDIGRNRRSYTTLNNWIATSNRVRGCFGYASGMGERPLLPPTNPPEPCIGKRPSRHRHHVVQQPTGE